MRGHLHQSAFRHESTSILCISYCLVYLIASYLDTCLIFILFYFILTLIWLVGHAELLDTCLFSQKTFEGIKTETWVRLGKYHKEYVVSRENKNQRDVVVADKSWCAKLN